MVVAQTYKRQDRLRTHKIVFAKYTYGNGDTSIVFDTGLKIVYSYSVSPTSVVTKQVTDSDVSGGTITVTVADPLGAAYLFITAIGI
jgi:hypothetical protein